MPEFWCVRRKILRHQHLCLIAGKFSVKAPQLPAPCTFPSAVWGSSWVLLLPELWACKSIKDEQGLEAVANLSSVLPPRLYLILLYLSFRSCSELWHKLIPAFHCMLYCFFVLVKREIYLLVLNTILFVTLLCERVCSMCVFLQWYLERETSKHSPTNSNLPTLPSITTIIHSKLNLGD